MTPITAIAFDYGLKNIGIAYGQSLTGQGKELSPINADNGIPNWKTVGNLIEEWKPNLLIVGLPLNMDDTESELCARARKFGRRLHGRFHIPVKMMDERLSTFDAKQSAKARGHKGDYHNNPIDSIAARLILESWFRQHAD